MSSNIQTGRAAPIHPAVIEEAKRYRTECVLPAQAEKQRNLVEKYLLRLLEEQQSENAAALRAVLHVVRQRRNLENSPLVDRRGTPL
jgi:hypothetical protein